jgi:hypothetical protein
MSGYSIVHRHGNVPTDGLDCGTPGNPSAHASLQLDIRGFPVIQYFVRSHSNIRVTPWLCTSLLVVDVLHYYDMLLHNAPYGSVIGSICPRACLMQQRDYSVTFRPIGVSILLGGPRMGTP